MTWGDCEAQVKGFKGARYKKFDSMAAADNFISVEGGATAYSNAAHAMPKQNYYSNNSRSNTTKSNLNKRSYSTSTKQNRNKNYGPNDDSDYGYIDKIIERSAPNPQRKTQLIEPPQPKRRRTDYGEFETDENGFVQVYTDGACSDNGRLSARAGLGIYWGDGNALNTSAPVSGQATNNCGEIQAATLAIKQALANGVKQLSINTDSKFLINAATKWIPGKTVTNQTYLLITLHYNVDIKVIPN